MLKIRTSWMMLASLVAACAMMVGFQAAQPDKTPAAPKSKQPATDKAAAPAPPPGMDDEAMKKAMAAMMPGEAHKKLAKRAGEWTTATTMSAPGMPAEESTGTSTITVVMDGRFIQEDDSGTMMGMPFTSRKLIGYNNGSKKYEANWVYTMGTGMMNMTGESSDDGKTIKWDATFVNEVGVAEKINITTTVADDDHFTVEMRATDPAAGDVVMTTKFTRKK